MFTIDCRRARQHDGAVAEIAAGPEMLAAARAYVYASVEKRNRTSPGSRPRVCPALTAGLTEAMADVLVKVVAFRRGQPTMSESDAALIKYLCNPPLESPITATETKVVHAMASAWKSIRDAPQRVRTNDQRLAELKRRSGRVVLNDIPDWDRDIEVVHQSCQQRIARALQTTNDPKLLRRLNDPEAATMTMWTQLLTTSPPIKAPRCASTRPVASATSVSQQLHGPADGQCWFFGKTGARCTARAGRFWCPRHCAGATINPAFITIRGEVKAAKDCPGECPVYASGPNAGKPRAGVSKGFHFCTTCRNAQHARYTTYTVTGGDTGGANPIAPGRRRRRQSSITEWMIGPPAKQSRQEDPAASSSTIGPGDSP